MEKVMLWQEKAPYSDNGVYSFQPSYTPYPVENSRGAIVVVPGGGYEMKAEDHEGHAIARMLNSRGISAFVLDYRVKPCHREAPLSDAKRCIRLVRAMGYQKVGILGFSAGGHLCCSAGTLFDTGDPDNEDPIERISSRPDVFVPCYAVASFGEYTHKGSRDALLGEEKENEELIRHYSSELNVTKDTPEAFLWHTAEDNCVPVQNTLLLAKALADHGVLFELHVYPKGPHGVGLGAEIIPVANWAGDLCSFLLERGFGR